MTTTTTRTTTTLQLESTSDLVRIVLGMDAPPSFGTWQDVAAELGPRLETIGKGLTHARPGAVVLLGAIADALQRD